MGHSLTLTLFLSRGTKTEGEGGLPGAGQCMKCWIQTWDLIHSCLPEEAAGGWWHCLWLQKAWYPWGMEVRISLGPYLCSWAICLGWWDQERPLWGHQRGTCVQSCLQLGFNPLSFVLGCPSELAFIFRVMNNN